MSTSVVLIAVLFVCVAAEPLTARFESFRVAHKKEYATEAERLSRFDVFKSNVNFIDVHNDKHLNYTLGVNKFADMTFAEFKQMFGLGRKFVGKARDRTSTVDLSSVVNPPDQVDWTTKGVVSPVKNQGQCGSCWSFSTTGSIEGAHAIKTGKLVSLSEEQLVDCAWDGNHGCNGGLPDFAFTYVIDEGGLCTETAYPYSPSSIWTPWTCKAKQCTDVVTIRSYVDVKASDEVALKAAAMSQPISVGIEADQREFQFYKSGIMDGECGTQLDHAVLVVGYGVEGGKKYWKVKNSWGAEWGDSGYIRLSRTESTDSVGQCGIAMMASYPVA